jgi:hypothetical protein
MIKKSFTTEKLTSIFLVDFFASRDNGGQPVYRTDVISLITQKLGRYV